MNKKLYLIIFSAVLFSLLTSSTCNKGNMYWEIGEVGASFTGLSNSNFYSDAQNPILEDSIIMQLHISPIYLSSNNLNFSIIKQAQAYSPGYDNATLNHSISELIISSDHDFNGKAAGENLNEFFVFLDNAAFDYYDSSWTYYDTLSVQDYVYQNLSQESYGYRYFNSIFLFKERPTAKSQVFYFDFINSIGTHYFGKSDTLWID